MTNFTCSIVIICTLHITASYWCMSKYYETKGTAQAFHIHMAVLTFTFSEEKFWLSFGKLTNTHRLIYFMCHYGEHITPLNLILGVS